MKPYSIVIVNLDPTKGSEIRKTRPCLIVSPDEMNRNLKTVVIAPMTTNLSKYPTRFVVDHNGIKGMIAIDQIRTIDKGRIVSVVGTLSPKKILECKAIIKETYVD